MKFDELADSIIEEGWKDVAAAAMIGLGALKGVNAGEIHTVKPGQSLSVIAKEYPGVSWMNIAKANNLQAPYVIKPGQKLKIPSKEITMSRDSKPKIGGGMGQDKRITPALINRIKQVEGSNNFETVKTIHRVKQNDPTIGWGHSLKHDNGAIKKVLGVNPEIYKQGAEISEQDAEKLLMYDLSKRLDQISKPTILPNYFSYPQELQITLMDMLYRGDMLPENSRALRNGDINTVIRYLERVAQAKARTEPGVTKRLRGHIPVFQKYKNVFN